MNGSELIFIRRAFDNVIKRLKILELKDRSNATQSVAFGTLAQINDVSNQIVGKQGPGQMRWCTDCCKVGESSSAGTGTDLYWDVTNNRWQRIRDDAAASN